ncbi:DUF5110 domain-containing protein [bacterium]|nr:DUF5110 domain-containing protein [bacterium]
MRRRFTKILSVFGVAAVLAAGGNIASAEPQEAYYDQFDWGMAMGDPGSLNVDFWKGNRQLFRYDPRVEMGGTRGAARIGNGAVYAGLLGTGSIAHVLPKNDFELYTSIRMTDFVDSGSGERNAEIAFRSDKQEGYLITLDGLNDRIRLRRQGGGFNDLIEPHSCEIKPGDLFYVHLKVEGAGPVRITAQVSTDPTFEGDALVFDETVVESVWVMNNTELVLIGFTPEGPYTFDFGYFSIGEIGYEHPPSAWTRRHFTDSPPMPDFVQLGNLTSYDAGTTCVVFQSDQGSIRLVPRLEGTVQMDFSPTGDFGPRESWSVTREDWPETPFEVTDGNPIVIEGAGWRVDIERDPIRPIYRSPDGTMLVEHPVGRPPLAAGKAREIAFTLEPDEDVYGFGGGPGSSGIELSRRGYLLRVLSTRQRLSHTIVPFWVTPRNYGIFVDNPAMGWLDLGFGNPEQAVYSSDEGELTWYVMVGESMYSVLEQYSDLVGRADMPPRWTLGNVHLSTTRDSIADIHRLVEEFQIRALPLDAVTVDSSQVNGMELPQQHMDVRIVSNPQVQSANGTHRPGERDWREADGTLGGLPHWNPDLGGYWGKPSGELYLRWAQFALFDQLFQPRGRETIEPWSFGPEIEAGVRDALELRYELLPCHYTLARQAYDSGIPVLRPLVLEWPSDPQVRDLGTEFLFGPHLLARPVTDEHGDRAEVYLPQGRWFDWFTGAAIDGPTSISVAERSDRFPLYVKAPAIIPLGSSLGETGETVKLRIWPPKRGRTVHGRLYEDDGLSMEYKDGRFATTTYEVEAAPMGDALKIRIGGAVGSYDGQPDLRRYEAEIHLLDQPESAQFQGKPLPQISDPDAWDTAERGWAYDSENHWLRLRGTPLAIDSGQEFTVAGDPVSNWDGWSRREP